VPYGIQGKFKAPTISIFANRESSQVFSKRQFSRLRLLIGADFDAKGLNKNKAKAIVF
jgi:hypothetical protein